MVQERLAVIPSFGAVLHCSQGALLLVQQVELIASQLCGAQMFGRAAEVLGKLLDRSDITADRVG
jgi:hypothetical protein